jgi:DNA-binding NarL/FixJ family response regulator
MVLVNLQLPGNYWIQSVVPIREYHPATRVIISTSDDSDEVRANCLAQGADAAISKRRLHQEFRHGIAAPWEPLTVMV